MKKIRYIYLSIMVALSLVSCQKEPIKTENPNDVPQGYVKMEIESLSDFGNIELSTRSGDGRLIATAREMAIKNAYLCVFEDNDSPTTDKLIQFKPVIRDVVGAATMYYAVLEEVNSPVILHGVSNIDQATIDVLSATEVGGEYSMTLHNFYNNVNMTYPGTTNQILRNSDNGLLPKYVDKIELTELTRDKIKDVKAVTKFSYSRIDVVMPEPYAEYPQVLGASVSNAPTLPYSPSRTQTFVESHEVVPSSNQHSFSGEFWPTGVTNDNQSSKYVQGMYTYSTGANAINDIAKATYLIIRARKDASSPATGTYYKIAMRLKDGITGEYDYSIKESNRYLVRVHALDSDGYASAQEAIAGPPSNINYDITVDGTSTSVTSNGQYYIGSEKIELSAEGKSKSNMVYLNPTITEFEYQSDDSWTINTDGTLGVDLIFSYNAGDASTIGVGDLTRKIVFPDGVEYDDAAGYADNSTNWDDSFGTKKLRLKVSGNIDDNIEIKVGELTHKVKISTKGELFTDYTDVAFVNNLTGLGIDGDYGGVSQGQLRVANSYILAPMQTAPTIYYIPVAERINEFWNTTDGYAGASATDIYADLLTTDWTNNTSYSVEVSWYDGADVDNLVVEKVFSPAGKNAIKVTLPPDFEHQNIAVNVKHGATIIWSWHLWVTDYNPYFTQLKEDENSELKYPVRTKTDQNQAMAGTGNALHSYAGTIWQSGIYKDKFIMDRNLGALGSDFVGHGSISTTNGTGQGSLQYQFGRKDPFPNKSVPPKSNGSKTLIEAVNQPTTFFIAANWCSEVQSVNYAWNDPKISNTEYSSAFYKSIFDPCPLGFKLGIEEAWRNNLTNSNFSWSATDYGRYYNIEVYYPAAGYRHADNGNLAGIGVYGPVWSALPYSETGGEFFNFNNTGVYPHSQSSYTRGSSFPVRPIQE